MMTLMMDLLMNPNVKQRISNYEGDDDPHVGLDDTCHDDGLDNDP